MVYFSKKLLSYIVAQKIKMANIRIKNRCYVELIGGGFGPLAAALLKVKRLTPDGLAVA
jgi:hypothetical protein